MKNDFKVLLFYPNEPLLGIAPTHLAILSACLKKAGFDTKLFDCTVYRCKKVTNDDVRAKLGHVKETNIDDYFIGKNEDIYEAFIRTVEEYKPDLIGMSVIDSTISFSLNFLKLIQDKNIPVVFGGVGATFSYERILNSGLVDYVCIGEGEETIVELATNIKENKDCSTIRNIYSISNGIIIKNHLRPLVDINKTPMPDFSIYESYRFYRPFKGNVVRVMAIDSDRGCAWWCKYCAAPAIKDLYKDENMNCYYRVKTFDKVFEEIKYLVKTFDINYLSFFSETFTALPLEKFKEFANRYKKEIGLPFFCQSRLDKLTEEKTKLLSEMGCKSIAVGLEHGSEKIRSTLLDKRLTNDQIISAFKELAKYNISPAINCMIGLPDEKREEVFETINLTRKAFQILKGKCTMNVFTFIPFSGTQLRKISIEKGYITGDEDIPISFFDRSLLNMPTMNKDEIHGLEKTFVLYMSLPESYYPEIKIAEKNDEEGQRKYKELMQIKNELLKDIK